ncbi:hypothetical protein ACFL6C_12540 [Myxococcota bacterium]
MGDPISIQKIKDAGFVNVRDNDNDHKLSSPDHVELPVFYKGRQQSKKISPAYAAVVYENYRAHVKDKGPALKLDKAVGTGWWVAGKILMPKPDPKKVDHYIYEINYVSGGRTKKVWAYPDVIKNGKATLTINSRQVVLNLTGKQSEWRGRPIVFKDNGIEMQVYRCTLHPRYVDWARATKTNGDMRQLLLDVYGKYTKKCQTGRG